MRFAVGYVLRKIGFTALFILSSVFVLSAINQTYCITYIITYLYFICQVILYVRGENMAKKLQISKRSNIKGDDGYKVFSVRIKDETVERLEQIAQETNRSRNELINMMLEFGIENCEITEPREK